MNYLYILFLFVLAVCAIYSFRLFDSDSCWGSLSPFISAVLLAACLLAVVFSFASVGGLEKNSVEYKFTPLNKSVTPHHLIIELDDSFKGTVKTFNNPLIIKDFYLCSNSNSIKFIKIIIPVNTWGIECNSEAKGFAVMEDGKEFSINKKL